MVQLEFIILTTAAFAAGYALDVHKTTPNVSRMAHNIKASIQEYGLPAHYSPPEQTQHTSRLKRDGAAQGFFDDDLASDADWKKFTEKGGALMCGLNGNDEEAGLQMGDKRTPPSAASPWTGDLMWELQTWKWSTVDPTTYSCKMNDHWAISEAMRSLGLNGKPQSEGGDNTCYRVEHWDPKASTPAINQWYTVDGKDYQATKAHYEFATNAKGGAIFAFYLESPIYSASNTWFAGRKPADPAKLPQLRAFSDILWGYWIRQNPDVKNIRYFFMLGISNEETNQLIAACLAAKGKTLREWPGVRFDTATDEGHALLGSPNGAAFAYFLMQRKKELGHKTITHVTVFRAETDDDLAFVDPHLVFHVGDVEGKARDEKVEEDGDTSLVENKVGAGAHGYKL